MKKYLYLLFVILNITAIFQSKAQIQRNRDFKSAKERGTDIIEYVNIMDINWDKALLAYQVVYKLQKTIDPTTKKPKSPCNCNYKGWQDNPYSGVYYAVYDLNQGKELKRFYVLKSAYDPKDCSNMDKANENALAFLDYTKPLGLKIEWNKFKPFTFMNRVFLDNHGKVGDLNFSFSSINNEYDDVGYTLGGINVNGKDIFGINQDHLNGGKGKFLFERVYANDDKYLVLYEYFWQDDKGSPKLQVLDFSPVFEKNPLDKELVDLFISYEPNNKYFLKGNYNVKTPYSWSLIVKNNDKIYPNTISDYVFNRLKTNEDKFLIYENKKYIDELEDRPVAYSKIKIVEKTGNKWKDITKQYFKDRKTKFDRVNAIKFYPDKNLGRFYDKAGKPTETFFFRDDKINFVKPQDFVITNNSAGKIKPGMNINQIAKLFPYLTYKKEQDESGGVNYYFEEYDDFMNLYQGYEQDYISYIEISSAAFMTEKGISTASTLGALKKAYPDLQVKNEEGAYEQVWRARTKELPNVIFSFAYRDNAPDDHTEIRNIEIRLEKE